MGFQLDHKLIIHYKVDYTGFLYIHFSVEIREFLKSHI